MRVELLIPDVAATATPKALPDAFARALDGAAQTLGNANTAEDAFAAGTGSMQAAAYARAQADVAVAVASAVTGRIIQTLQALTSMQV